MNLIRPNRMVLYTTLALLLNSQAGIYAQKNETISTTITADEEDTGPSLTDQIIVFQDYQGNANGIVRAMYTPELRVLFSLSNQQYDLPLSQLSSGKGLSFGAAPNSLDSSATGAELYCQMNSVSFPASEHFTFSSITPGSGIDVNVKKAIQLFTSARPLYNSGAATNGRYYYGDLTISFSEPVTDPILHIVGLGGFRSSLGFTTELEMQDSNISLSKLSGSDELSISGHTKILNSSTDPDSYTGAGAASGSVLVLGTQINSITFKVYLRGDGDMNEWGTDAIHAGDIWLMGVSLNTPAKNASNMFAYNDGNTNESSRVR